MFVVTGGLLYAVNGPSFSAKEVTVAGFTVDMKTGSVIQSWRPPQVFIVPIIPDRISTIQKLTFRLLEHSNNRFL